MRDYDTSEIGRRHKDSEVQGSWVGESLLELPSSPCPRQVLQGEGSHRAEGMDLPEEQLAPHYHSREPSEMQVVSPVPWSDGPWSWASVSSGVDRSAELSICTAGTDGCRCESSAMPQRGLRVPKGVSCYSLPAAQAK